MSPLGLFFSSVHSSTRFLTLRFATSAQRSAVQMVQSQRPQDSGATEDDNNISEGKMASVCEKVGPSLSRNMVKGQTQARRRTSCCQSSLLFLL